MRGPNTKLDPGDTYECDDGEEAARLINKGIAEAVKRGRRKKAVITPDEKTVIE